MLTIAPAQAVGDQVSNPELLRLCGSTFLLSWTLDDAAMSKHSISLTCGGKRAASASLTLSLSDGRTRIVSAFRHGGHEEITAKLSIGQLGPDTFISFDPELTHAMAEAGEVAKDLAPAARIALANALIGTWPTLFNLRETGAYLAFLRQFLLTLSRKPVAALPAAALPNGKTLLETSVPSRLATVRAAYWLDQSRLGRIEARPRLGMSDKAGRRALHLVAGEFQPRHGGLLVLQSDIGLIVRALPERAPVPTLSRWWASKASARDGLRSWLVEQLTAISEQGRLLAIEMQRRLPLPVQSVRRRDELPSAEVDLAVCSQAGLLLGGWYRDPDGSIEEILVHRSEGEPMPIREQMERFPALLPAEEPGGDRRTANGFLGLVPGYATGAPVLQPRCEIRLKSGTSLFVRPAPQPADAVTIRARALASIPPQFLTGDILERTLAPVLAACQATLRESLPEPRLKPIGTPPAQPSVSIVIPLYRVYDFLRVQVASFAGDPWFRDNAELIYVLDSPEHEGEVAHLLGGLHLAYGLPMQLVVMGRNGGFSAACNAGAELARGETLALVNSDIIPTEPGWLPALARKLDRHVGAVGPKLLYDDGSLQHAGLLFKRDRHGVWLNHHYYKGMPGNYGPANAERLVPGVTGACIVMPLALYKEVGGFDASYVIGDYEDSDLCLKVRAAGFGIKYVPGVALYHLERQSISKSADYTRGVASQHNSWLQTKRWNSEIEALMSDETTPAGKLPPVREPEILSRTVLRRATAA